MKQNNFLDNYFKTIVFDIDDTISITTIHDWKNATPNIQIINKINALYDNGWTIILQTARGQISCKGNSQKADEKYRVQIEEWLKFNNVKYHFLSFEKYLAAYYVDDKALTPDEFLNLDIRDFKTGLSGAHIELRGNKIFKTNLQYPDSLNEATWYNMAAPLINVPIVYNVIGNTICMEFLKSSGQKFKLSEINEIIKTFSCYKQYVPFEVYIKRIEEHCKIHNDFFEVLDLLKEEEEFFNNNKTFCHGDFSLENIIQTKDGLFLIDPIYNPNNYSSYLLDISKLLHSFRKYNRMFEYEVFLNNWRNFSKHLSLLEITQWIRILKYVKNIELKNQYFSITKDLIKCYIS